jgi:GTPase SAR1 family protein
MLQLNCQAAMVQINRFKKINGIVGVYDVTNKNSFDMLRYVLNAFVERHQPTNDEYKFPILILGNKNDEDQQEVSVKEAKVTFEISIFIIVTAHSNNLQELSSTLGAYFVQTSKIDEFEVAKPTFGKLLKHMSSIPELVAPPEGTLRSLRKSFGGSLRVLKSPSNARASKIISDPVDQTPKKDDMEIIETKKKSKKSDSIKENVPNRPSNSLKEIENPPKRSHFSKLKFLTVRMKNSSTKRKEIHSTNN